jgi:hypothetical protein
MTIPVSIGERPISRHGSVKDKSETREYVVGGLFDKSLVEAYAIAASPTLVATAAGILYRQDVQVKPAGFLTWHVSVPYGERKKENGSYKLSFDTTGGTVRIFSAKSHIASYPVAGSPPDHKGAINVKDDGNVEGVDRVIPALKLSVAFQHPLGIITLPQIKQLARKTGMVNSDSFLTFSPGELLFLGATGSEGSEVETEVTYHFAASENVTGLTFGDVANVAKKGHEVLWIEYKDAVSNNKPARQPEFVHVERVYDEVEFAVVFGWN